MNNRNGPSLRGQSRQNDFEENLDDDLSPLKGRLEQQKKQQQIDFTEFTVFIITTLLMTVMTFVMTSVNFKMFSIILFFTAPMWVLLIESVLLMIIRMSKSQSFL